MKIGVVSLGCAKNIVDSEVMMGLLADAGHEFVAKAGEADAILVNTCGFVEKAKREAIDAIFEAAMNRRDGAKLIVTGCLAQRYPEEIMQEIPEVDAVLGIGEIGGIAGHIERIVAGERYRKTDEGFRFTAARRVLTTPGHIANLKVADGCDNRCAYCAIPGIRGGFISRPMDELIGEAKALAEGGVKELLLVAQDTTRYGADLYGEPKLAELLGGLARIDGLRRLRAMYFYPEMITERLLDAMAEDGKVCRYIDVPIQHADDDILLAMNRRGGRAAIERAYRLARDRGFTLRTTVLVGFPGESDAQFQGLMSFLRDYPFDRLGAFAYSREEGTASAAMAGQVPGKVKRAREGAVMEQQRDISTGLLAARVGEVTDVLVDSVISDKCIGRSAAEAPDIDGVIEFDSANSMVGDMVSVRISDSSDYDLKGVPL